MRYLSIHPLTTYSVRLESSAYQSGFQPICLALQLAGVGLDARPYTVISLSWIVLGRIPGFKPGTIWLCRQIIVVHPGKLRVSKVM
jgi:hypothetical protein